MVTTLVVLLVTVWAGAVVVSVVVVVFGGEVTVVVAVVVVVSVVVVVVVSVLWASAVEPAARAMSAPARNAIGTRSANWRAGFTVISVARGREVAQSGEHESRSEASTTVWAHRWTCSSIGARVRRDR